MNYKYQIYQYRPNPTITAIIGSKCFDTKDFTICNQMTRQPIYIEQKTWSAENFSVQTPLHIIYFAISFQDVGEHGSL